jgi:flagellum-specific ATP synthase
MPVPTINLDKYHERLGRLNLLPCRGTVVRASGMVVESQGPPVGVGQLCEIRLSDGRRICAEVVGFNKGNRLLIPLESIAGVAPGNQVSVSSRPRMINVGPEMLGRVVDCLGQPIDDLGPVRGADRRPLEIGAIPPLSRERITRPLAFGIRAIDGLITCGRGQRMGVFSGSGVGKSTLLGEIARTSEADVNVLALVGERGREVRQFLEESLGADGLARSTVVVATSDASPVQRVRAAFTATAVAEYFRDRGMHVMLMMDSITRFAQAQREIGLSAGEPPTTKGYCPSVFAMLPKLTERAGATASGSITGIYTVLVEADDMGDPVADSVRALLDGHIVLTRTLAEQGHYPAVDILQSISRLMTSVISPAHRSAAQKLRAVYATYRNAEDLINIGAMAPGANRRIDKAVSLIDKVNEFLVQPLGGATSLDETVRRMTEITRSWDFIVPGGQQSPADTQVEIPDR